MMRTIRKFAQGAQTLKHSSAKVAENRSRLLPACANFPTTVQHSTKHFHTTKITRAKKSGGFETRPYIFLRPLRSLWLHYFFFVIFVRFVVKICLSLLTLFWLRLRRAGFSVVVLSRCLPTFFCLVPNALINHCSHPRRALLVRNANNIPSPDHQGSPQ